jgi:hypothetical protein
MFLINIWHMDRVDLVGKEKQIPLQFHLVFSVMKLNDHIVILLYLWPSNQLCHVNKPHNNTDINIKCIGQLSTAY